MELPFLSLFNLLAFPCRVRERQRASLVANLETCCLDSNPGLKERDHGQVLQAPELHAAVVLAVSQEAH